VICCQQAVCQVLCQHISTTMTQLTHFVLLMLLRPPTCTTTAAVHAPRNSSLLRSANNLQRLPATRPGNSCAIVQPGWHDLHSHLDCACDLDWDSSRLCHQIPEVLLLGRRCASLHHLSKTKRSERGVVVSWGRGVFVS
jgi:hypothetical protein